MPRQGQYAKIYQNPLLREGYRGDAILIEKKVENSMYEYWLCEFPDTGEKSVRRLVKYDYGL